MSDKLLVRIHPYDKGSGHAVRRYCYGETMFREEVGWYSLLRADAERLRGLRVDPYNTNSPLVFEICSAEEAAAKEVAERRARAERAGIRLPATQEQPAEPERVTTPERKGAPLPRLTSVQDVGQGGIADLLQQSGDGPVSGVVQPEPAAPEPDEDDAAADGEDDSGQQAEAPKTRSQRSKEAWARRRAQEGQKV